MRIMNEGFVNQLPRCSINLLSDNKEVVIDLYFFVLDLAGSFFDVFCFLIKYNVDF